jgi:oligopeptide/dipeptide ABC transporter ATP-binding protein
MTNNEPVLEVKNLRKLFPVSRGIVGFLRRLPKQWVHAVDDISFTLQKGEILALVGESGSGKTTTGLCTLGLVDPTEGQILLENEDVLSLNHSRKRKDLRRKAQLIFQDPYESLNPRQTVLQAVAEPLEVHALATSKSEKIDKVSMVLEDAGLKPAASFLHRYPQQLSGGQRQRVVIASALILNPLYLVADEPVSMLDVSIRAEILNLLLQLRDEHKISMVYITHDLASAAYIADRVAVMYLGVIVEIGSADVVLRDPRHPYTKALMSVIPAPNPRQREKRIILEGETPNPIDIPNGCRFHPRCPIAISTCSHSEPILENIGANRQVACILANASNK